MKNTRSFLKWAGNKYSCLQQILPAFPKAKRLIEPFTGSATVFANTAYSDYLLAEANADLILLFKQLQQEGESFINYCEQFFTQANNQAPPYYQLRRIFNQTPDTREKAAIFLYLNRHGYNGLCRYNSEGIYNVPFGARPKAYFPRKEMLHFFRKSQQATFIHSDFQNTFQMAQKGDLIYCDPPYIPLSETADFASYTTHGFSEAAHITLAQLATETAARGIPVIISNHDTDFTRQHYQQAHITSFLVSRRISCKADNRKPVKELLAVF